MARSEAGLVGVQQQQLEAARSMVLERKGSSDSPPGEIGKKRGLMDLWIFPTSWRYTGCQRSMDWKGKTDRDRVKCRGERGKQNRRSRINVEIREGFKRWERSSDFRGKRGG